MKLCQKKKYGKKEIDYFFFERKLKIMNWKKKKRNTIMNIDFIHCTKEIYIKDDFSLFLGECWKKKCNAGNMYAM